MGDFLNYIIVGALFLVFFFIVYGVALFFLDNDISYWIKNFQDRNKPSCVECKHCDEHTIDNRCKKCKHPTMGYFMDCENVRYTSKCKFEPKED